MPHARMSRSGSARSARPPAPLAPLPLLALALLLLLAPALPALPALQATGDAASGGDAVSRGDAAWARRAEGHVGAHASPGPIGEAIAAYEQALKEQPERLEVCWKLLRAEHFRGDFVAITREQKQQVFGPARTVAEAGLDRLARKAGGRDRLDTMAPAAAAKALAGIPEAAPLHLWAGIHWGLWGDNFGRLAAARQGVGERVRRYSEVVIAIDERYEHAGGHRLLGRLHTLAPKVPFLTGWVDRDKAVAELRRAVALAPDYPLNAVFLADALLQYRSGDAAEVATARRLLHQVVERPPGPERPWGVVEDEDAAAQARALLAKYRG
jgi:tetratricopeptide (TPR) repeat protein